MKIGICIQCGESKNIKARGLCSSDYNNWLEVNEERAWKKTNYPSEDKMVEMCIDIIGMNELARMIGVSREALRDYLRIRPNLKDRVKESLNLHREEIIRSRELASKQRWKERNPEKVRSINRKWGRNQDAAKRARWNSYNRERRRNSGATLMGEDDLEFTKIIRKDPCSYCSSPASGTVDHILPLALGGDSSWSNLTGACHSCNASKNDTTLVLYLLREAHKADRLGDRHNNG